MSESLTRTPLSHAFDHAITLHQQGVLGTGAKFKAVLMAWPTIVDRDVAIAVYDEVVRAERECVIPREPDENEPDENEPDENEPDENDLPQPVIPVVPVGVCEQCGQRLSSCTCTGYTTR